MTETGEMIWEYDKDLLEDVRIDSDVIRLSFYDGPTVALDAMNGQVVSDGPA